MKTLAAIYRNILSLRYKISLKGTELLKNGSAKLILPNHQAHVDPQILITQLMKHANITPMVAERFFNVPVLKGILKRLNAVPVSNILSDKIEANTVDKVVECAIKTLSENKNVLLYPAGQLAGQGFEKIFNKSSAYNIVKNMPLDSKIIGVRINGLWGSMWSKAWSGDTPPVVKNLFKGLFFILSNLIFLIPKRQVTIEFVDITEKAKAAAYVGKQEFNDNLERFYNTEEETVRFLKHFFFFPKMKRKLPEKIIGSLKEVESTNRIDPDLIPDEILSGIKKAIVKEIEIDEYKITAESNLTTDLGFDSLGLVFLVSAVEEKYGKPFTGNFANLKTVADVCLIAMGESTDNQTLKPSLVANTGINHYRVRVNAELNIRNHFIQTVLENKKEPIAYDKMIGSNTRKDLLLKSIVVSKLIKKHIKEDYVGIMLPALQSTALLIMATYFAGKIPVMLNWTVGKGVIKDCMKSVGLKKVITATSFYEKVVDMLPEKFDNNCLFFDKEIKKVNLGTKLGSLFQSFFPTIFYTNKKLPDTAVILFTSGSETKPKAVPLTHKNIMANLYGVLDSLEMYSDDILLGFLPPFHSFGFTVLSILPLVSGLKVAYTPNPTDSREVTKILNHTKANVILATPTFLKLMMAVAKDDDFNHVRLAVTGAESLHPSIEQQFRKKTGNIATVIQGYGITECSPILTITSYDTKDLKSVGKFITGVDYKIVDVNTYKPVKKGTEGLIIVCGKSIFNGYLDESIPSPFIEVDNVQYYKTGDLGYIDKRGDLFITGRLKRFIKIAGEMISLPAIESVLNEEFGSLDEQTLAVEADESESIAKIVLFSTQKLSLPKVNQHLKEKGFSNLMKISTIKQIEEIPLLGSGKTDYKLLKQMVKETSLVS